MSVTINHQTNSVEPSSGNLSIGGSGNVGIGTSSPSRKLTVFGSNNTTNFEVGDASGGASFNVYSNTTNSSVSLGTGGSSMSFAIAGSDKVIIDSSGNVYVGGTTYEGSTTSNASSSYHGANGFISANVNNDFGMQVNRTGTDGTLFNFRKNGTDVGSIAVGGSSAQPIIGSRNTGSGGTAAGLRFDRANNSIQPWNVVTNASADNIIDLGFSSIRFDDIYATIGTIQTSDRNEKQDIRDLTEAEQRVAVACKGLLKAWRWKSAVEEKGDDARIHCGIIAQDLQAAFAAEGLDAGRYAMFMSNTWWEHDVEVPAVEAVAEVLDEEGNVVTEAVEAKDAYTRTDTYDTQEEAPEGATERTRLGVRYSELLAFIIAAI